MLMVGGHVVRYSMITTSRTTSKVQGDPFLLQVDFQDFTVIQDPYFFTRLTVGHRIVVVVFGELDVIVTLHGGLHHFFGAEGLCR